MPAAASAIISFIRKASLSLCPIACPAALRSAETASRLASAIERVAVALLAEEQSAPHNGALVRAHQSLVRP